MEGKAVSCGWTAMLSAFFSRSGLGSFSCDPRLVHSLMHALEFSDTMNCIYESCS